ncbi:MAG: hypothetical protein HYZ37_07570 [Candidatus Solibacter usitatus]|nr:hypothetical protein [Candidatus Solibacter usitatus]
MSEQPAQPYYQAPPPAGGALNIKIAVLFGAVVALLAANVYLFLQLDGVRKELTKAQEGLHSEIANLREASSVTAQTQKRASETLRDELEAARRQAAMAVGAAKTEAEAKVADLKGRVEADQKRASAAQAALRTEIGDVKKETTETKEKLGAVNTEVGVVKTEVAQTKSELDKTVAALKTVQGDLGVQSGLIATNGKELSALKALGDRNYFEFNLGRTKAPVKVGDITMLLKKTDQKKNRYTVEVTADDKRTEKKDKTVNEPLQFLTSKSRIPYEIVVNEVKKDAIVGYLATPKVTIPR